MKRIKSGVAPHRIISKTIPGSVPTSQRPGFTRLLDKMEQGDVLIVTKLDRLGRNAIDVATTVAQFESDLLVERTQAGLARAKAEGKLLGRPPALSKKQYQLVLSRLQGGDTVSAIARDMKTSRQTIMRIRDAA